MITIRIKFMLLAMAVLMTACGEPVKAVLGDWIWIESSGGLLPARTPENTGNTARLNLTRDQWCYFEDGQQTDCHEIKIKRRAKGLIIDSEPPHEDKIVDFINNDEITVTYYGGPNSDCQDCVVRRFVRVTN